MKEHALFLGKTQPVLGIVTEPPASAAGESRVGVVLSNSGIVHRVGPSRVYVKLARRLASQGFVVARIDHRGIGDSPQRTDRLPFLDAATMELREIMDDMERRWGTRRFLAGGICLGAEIAFKTAQVDERIAGIFLINGVGYMEGAEWHKHAMTRSQVRDYVQRGLVSWDSWRRALTGRIEYRHLARSLWGYGKTLLRPSKTVEVTSDKLASEFRTVLQREVRIIWIHSYEDTSIEFRRMLFPDETRQSESPRHLQSAVIAEADHTFTQLASQTLLVETIEQWASPILRESTASVLERGVACHTVER